MPSRKKNHSCVTSLASVDRGRGKLVHIYWTQQYFTEGPRSQVTQYPCLHQASTFSEASTQEACGSPVSLSATSPMGCGAKPNSAWLYCLRVHSGVTSLQRAARRSSAGADMHAPTRLFMSLSPQVCRLHKVVSRWDIDRVGGLGVGRLVVRCWRRASLTWRGLPRSQVVSPSLS